MPEKRLNNVGAGFNPLSEKDVDQLKDDIALLVVDRIMKRSDFQAHRNKGTVLQLAGHFVFQALAMLSDNVVEY